jgi:hypothetical protein
MKYHYFVSFAFGTTAASGFGNLDIVRDYPIDDHTDIQEIQREISERAKQPGITVLFWKQY